MPPFYDQGNPDKAITVDPFNEETDVLMFKPVDSTYFSKHPDIDAIVAFNAGSFVYPSMVSAGVADTMKLFAAGYNDGDNAVFGSKGAYQQEMVCAVESITYPLVLLLNKINGASYSDQPETADLEIKAKCTYVRNTNPHNVSPYIPIRNSLLQQNLLKKEQDLPKGR